MFKRNSQRTRKTRSGLRKQPRRRTQRVEAQAPAAGRTRVTPAPPQTMPRSAQRRKVWTRTEPIRISAVTFKNAILSSRMVSFVLLTLCVIVLSLSWFQAGLYLHDFDIEGLNYVDAREVIEASGMQGVHIFAARPNDAVSSVRDLPGVVSADISVQWPNRTVINIEEEQPIAIWEQDGQAYWLNPIGHLIELRDETLDLVRITVDDAAGNNMPITIPDALDGEIDPLRTETRMIPPSIIENALELATINPAFRSLMYSASHGLTFRHDDGWFAYFGANGDMRVKATVYEAILEQLVEAETPIYYMDLSDEETVYYRPVDGTFSALPVQQVPAAPVEPVAPVVPVAPVQPESVPQEVAPQEPAPQVDAPQVDAPAPVAEPVIDVQPSAEEAPAAIDPAAQPGELPADTAAPPAGEPAPAQEEAVPQAEQSPVAVDPPPSEQPASEQAIPEQQLEQPFTEQPAEPQPEQTQPEQQPQGEQPPAGDVLPEPELQPEPETEPQPQLENQTDG